MPPNNVICAALLAMESDATDGVTPHTKRVLRAYAFGGSP